MPGTGRDRDGVAGSANDGTGAASSASAATAAFDAPVAGNLSNLAGERIVFRGRGQHNRHAQQHQQQQQQQGDQPPPPPPPVSGRTVSVLRRLGEGGFSYVYLVKDVTETTDNSAGGGVGVGVDGGSPGGGTNAANASGTPSTGGGLMVLKITSIQNREQRDMADKEAVLLRKLSHPSIITVYDSCFRGGGKSSNKGGGSSSEAHASTPRTIPQHMILMEYCECGHALDVIRNMQSSDPNQRFPLKHLIVSIGQIANAVSYLHAQRPPVVHRDLKLENFLVSRNGAVYKLCDFGSAVLGHVPLVTSKDRAEAGDVVQRTTTQMYRAPEMVDLYMTEWLTESTDVWALGCCLYTMAFFQNCFDQEGSNLAILSANYHKIPPDHRYQDTGLVELIQRMLEVKVDDRADMTEVITCLSAIYSKRPLPLRKKRKKSRERRRRGSDSAGDGGVGANGSGGGGRHGRSRSFGGDGSVVGTFRTDGQGVHQSEGIDGVGPGRRQEKKQAKKLNPNSAAARRIKAVRNSNAEASAEASPSSSAAVSPSTSLSGRRKTPDRKGSRRERDRIDVVGTTGAKSRSPSIGRRQTQDGSARRSRQRGGSFGSSAGSSTGGFEPAGLFNNDDNSFDFRPFDISPSVAKDSKHDGRMEFSDSNNPFAFSHSEKIDASACDVTDPFDFGGISSKGEANNFKDADDVSTSFPPFEADSLAASSRGDNIEGSPFSSDPRQAQHCATDDHGFAWKEATFPVPLNNEGSFTAARDDGRGSAGATKNSPAESTNEGQNERTIPWNRTGKVPPSGHHRKGSSDRYAFQDLETQLGRLRPSTTDGKPRSRTSTAGSSDYHTPGDSDDRTPGASSSTSSSFESLEDVRDFALGTFEVPMSRFEEMKLASRSNVNQEDNPSDVQDKVGVLEPMTTFEEV